VLEHLIRLVVVMEESRKSMRTQRLNSRARDTISWISGFWSSSVTLSSKDWIFDRAAMGRSCRRTGIAYAFPPPPDPQPAAPLGLPPARTYIL
jgi:hypothetical protein